MITFDDDHAKAEHLASQGADYLRAHGIDAHAAAPLCRGGVPQSLINEIRRLDCRLLVMGCFGKSRWHEFFLGSATRHLLEHAALPLLLVH